MRRRRGWGRFALVLVLLACGAAFTAGTVVTYLFAPHHVRIAAHGTPTIFEEAIPGEHQPESVTWTGGEVAIASGGRPDYCAFRSVDGGEADAEAEEQVVELEDRGDVTHPFAPWQWSGEPDVAAPAAVTCPGDGTAAIYMGDQAARWRWLGRGSVLPLLQVGPIVVAFAAIAVGLVWMSWSERRQPQEADDDPAGSSRRGHVTRGLAIAGAATAAIALATQLTVLVAAHDSPSAIDVAAGVDADDDAGDPHSLRSGPVLLTAERRDVGDLTSCTARGADGAERVLVLHAHPGPWHDNAWNPSEGTDIRRPFADDDFWIGTPEVAEPATISCSHGVQLYGGGEIATWFRYDETSPRLVHATAVPIGWLLFALIVWVLAGP